jgi:hypothetical protein
LKASPMRAGAHGGVSTRDIRGPKVERGAQAVQAAPRPAGITAAVSRPCRIAA